MQNNFYIGQRYGLYQAGKTDEEIAQIQCVEPETIAGWRFRNKLPMLEINKQKQYKELNDRRREMLRKGYSDKHIAALENVSVHSIKEWKWLNGLGKTGKRRVKSNKLGG